VRQEHAGQACFCSSVTWKQIIWVKVSMGRQIQV
jgi:hypothetical protein